MNMTQQFAQLILKWFKKHGRHDLPWQKNPTPYRVWISEIMLQQTQVSTVIPYFEKFMHHFPNIQSLAKASQDNVLSLWSGLGYYARARNLHKTAKIIHENYQNQFPASVESLMTLPGIGKSTAGAILSLSTMQKPTPILDGNVKRVLARCYAIEGWPGKTEVEQQLWQLTDALTPKQKTNEYNQAMMDLGATLCTRTQPKCLLCPLASLCEAHKKGQEESFPHKKPKKVRPIKQVTMLIFCNKNHEILLEKRSQYGIWGGLWSFPECPTQEDIPNQCLEYQCKILTSMPFKKLTHQFSHYQLNIDAHLINVQSQSNQLHEENSKRVWYNLKNPLPGGIPKPIAKLLNEIKTKVFSDE